MMGLCFLFKLIEEEKAYALPVVEKGPSWPRIEHGHSGITAHLETATFNFCETLNLGVQCQSRTTREGSLPSRV